MTKEEVKASVDNYNKLVKEMDNNYIKENFDSDNLTFANWIQFNTWRDKVIFPMTEQMQSVLREYGVKYNAQTLELVY